jgi:hypothetical protein
VFPCSGLLPYVVVELKMLVLPQHHKRQWGEGNYTSGEINQMSILKTTTKFLGLVAF